MMTLAPGTRLGPYEIQTAIGAGGMGEVYRARDTRLKRDVALKVLPESFASDPDRMARFQREAEVLASLNHSNIAAIYGLEEGPAEMGAGFSRPVQALVMELAEGETLADRIARGPIPVDEALPIAKQIAEALEAAHEHGIIHRDLKPANIKLRPDGTVKVLDFGLAKLGEAGAAGQASGAGMDAVSMSPTITSPAMMTGVGVLLGTAAYMSPEQSRGRRADKRADIWAFGCVLYEMLIGERPFEGEDVAQTLAAVLMKEPDLSRVPPNVRPLVASCLEKDPKKRLRDIGDAWRLLTTQSFPAPPVSNRRALAFAWAIASVIAIVGIVVGVVGWRAARPAPSPLKPIVRLNVNLGPDVTLGAFTSADVVLSPDGTRLAYVSQNRLYLQRLDDQSETVRVVSADVAYMPSFSPDGRWLSFYSSGRLNKVAVEGGTPIPLATASNPRGSSWMENGDIVMAPYANGGLSVIPGNGGEPVRLTQLAAGEITHRWPQVLPKGNAVLFTSHVTNTAFDAANIQVITLADHKQKLILRGGTFARYVPSGHLIYVSRGTLFAAAFDLDTLELRGTPVPVVDRVAYAPNDGYASVDMSPSGTLVYRVQSPGGLGQLSVQWVDAEGKTQPLLAKPDSYLYPTLSPDGQHLALSTSDVWVYDWNRDTMTRLTFDGGHFPAWSPDGRTIAFRKLGEGIFLVRSDGGSKPQQLIQSKNLPAAIAFIPPDGKRIAYQDIGPAGGYDLWITSLEDSGTSGGSTPEVLLQTQFNERWPSFSSDGRWLAYGSDESGSYQIYVRAFPDKGGKWQVSSAGGAYPQFSPNGRELFYRADDNRVMVASYTVKGDSFVVDKPRVWSPIPLANTGLNGRPYDLASDGKRVIGLMQLETPEARQSLNQVIFVQNFLDELQRRAPTGN